MNDIKAYVIIGIGLLSILGIMLFKAFIEPDKSAKRSLIIWTVISVICYVIFDALSNSLIIAKLPEQYLALVTFANMGYFIFLNTSALLWFFFSEYSQDSGLIKKDWQKALWCIPAFAVIVMTLISPWTGIMMKVYVEEGIVKYQSGSLQILQIILTLTYLVCSTVFAVVRAVNKNNYSKREFYVMYATFIVPTLIGTIVELIFSVPAIAIGITIAVLLVYIKSQETLVLLDPLTQMNNRRLMNEFLQKKISHHNKKLFLFMLDADDFKKINDEYGHNEGDEALITIATSLKMFADKKDYFVARYGGDEFCIIAELFDEGEAVLLCDAFEKILREQHAKKNKKYPLIMSIGYAQYDDSLKYIPDFIARADEELYKVKESKNNYLI